jgi:glycosyltransferase involved in cell wall biosynthesis
MKTIRILYLRDTDHICGPGKTIINTCRTIAKDRFSIVVGAPAGSRGAPNVFLERVTKSGGSVLPLRMGAYLDLGTLLPLVRYVRSNRIDIVQTHDSQTRRLGSIAAGLGGAVHIASLHGWIPNTLRQKGSVRLDQILIRYAEHIIVMSGEMKGQLAALGVPDEKMSVLHNSIVLEDYPPLETTGPLRGKLGIPDQAKIVAVIGRLSPEKGHALFLEMARRIHPLRPDARFLIVGDGPGMAALRHEADRLGLGDRVILTGFLADVRAVYAALDVLVIPSSTEGLPNVLLEAFAFGKPVVATPVGGIPEVLTEGESGYLVDPDDPDTFAQRVLALLNNPDLAREMGDCGRRTVLMKFNFQERTRRLERLYEDIMSRREGGRVAVGHSR